jgi:rhodanese-related sulfurtransferase
MRCLPRRAPYWTGWNPGASMRELASGAVLIDIRPVEQRQRDGELTGAIVIDRNVIEWRHDPTSPDRLPAASSAHIHYILVCNEGYSSSACAGRVRNGVADSCPLVI